MGVQTAFRFEEAPTAVPAATKGAAPSGSSEHSDLSNSAQAEGACGQAGGQQVAPPRTTTAESAMPGGPVGPLNRPAEDSDGGASSEVGVALPDLAEGRTDEASVSPQLLSERKPRPGTLRRAKAQAVDSGAPVYTRASLEQALQKGLGRELRVVLTDNERTMISARHQGQSLVVRVHHMFLQGSPQVTMALVGYLNRSDPAASQILFSYIKSRRGQIRRAPVRRIKVRTAGEHHDLQALFDALNEHYFAGSVTAKITWAKQSAPRNRSRRSIKLGSYHSGDTLIRIHPVLDAKWVPKFFVEFIIYHEMLHQVVVPKQNGARREYHCREFRRRERAFEHYAEAMAWERQHLRRLLRS